jgi:predicted enzyme related to lactoylglutathione lyase
MFRGGLMLHTEYNFYLTDAQKIAIHDVGVAEVEVSFCTSGMVNATVYGDYDITSYTFRKDGSIVKETRCFDSYGWVAECRDADGNWTSELEEDA